MVAWLLRPGMVAKYGDDEYVCLFVHSNNSKTTWPNFTKYLCMLPVAVACSLYDGVAIRYVLPVLRVTLCFPNMGSIGRTMEDVMFRGSLPGGATIPYYGL